MQKCGFARARSAVAYIDVREAVCTARNTFLRYFGSVLPGVWGPLPPARSRARSPNIYENKAIYYRSQ